MDYYEAMSYISNTYKFGKKAGLHRMRRLMEVLGNPQKGMKFVHIAGTNGKGSTSSYISTILGKAGYKTGLYISPYLQRFSERIRVGNEEISDEDIVTNILKIKDAIGIMEAEGSDVPTEFEILTAMGFLHYANNNCDVVVLEVGMGGIIDSTNMIDDEDSIVSVITTIGYDHMAYLGDTLPEIAEKKAGIFKQNGAAVVYPQIDEVMAVFEKEAAEKNVSMNKLLKSDVKVSLQELGRTVFDFGGYKNLEISLLGDHQVYNASLAVMAVEVLNKKGFNISEEVMREGLKSAKWPGRFEIVAREPMVIIDGAHNVEGALGFATGLKHYFNDKKLIFICGVLADKDYGAMLAPYIPMAKSFITVTPDNPRALSKEDLRDYLSKFHGNVVDKDNMEALEYALKTAEKDDIICAFGSLYYVGLIRDYFGLN